MRKLHVGFIDRQRSLHTWFDLHLNILRIFCVFQVEPAYTADTLCFGGIECEQVVKYCIDVSALAVNLGGKCVQFQEIMWHCIIVILCTDWSAAHGKFENQPGLFQTFGRKTVCDYWQLSAVRILIKIFWSVWSWRMGSSSKKHKKDRDGGSRKHKHRSRSHSPAYSGERDVYVSGRHRHRSRSPASPLGRSNVYESGRDRERERESREKRHKHHHHKRHKERRAKHHSRDNGRDDNRTVVIDDDDDDYHSDSEYFSSVTFDIGFGRSLNAVLLCSGHWRCHRCRGISWHSLGCSQKCEVILCIKGTKWRLIYIYFKFSNLMRDEQCFKLLLILQTLLAAQQIISA